MHVYLTLAKLVVTLLGLLIAYQAWVGYRRSANRELWFVAVGFAFISIGSLLEGILFDAFGLRFHDAGTIATVIVALGMLSVLYALYGNEARRIEPPVDE